MSRMDPIFIHSLFRSGSTYIFNNFRRSSAGYWCYQEPLNEFLLNAATRPEALIEGHENNARHLRHPSISRPYFYEYFPLASRIGETFRASFSYEDYFSNGSQAAEPLCRYLAVLATGAQGRPVFQECRSVGRVASIREGMGGAHLYLWRNPWDQWWSYKVDSHFDICNLQILASKHLPPQFEELRSIVGFVPTGSDATEVVKQRLDAKGSYILFFALWCHAMLEAMPRCEIDLNIDSLSLSAEYRSKVTAQLTALGITGLDFFDCAVPIGVYGKKDRLFFAEAEASVFALYLRHGYSASDIVRISKLREKHDCHGYPDEHVPPSLAKELDRMHQVAMRLESELNGAQRQLGAMADAQARTVQLDLLLTTKSAECNSLSTALKAKGEECGSLAAALKASEDNLARLMNSRYWRWGWPIRATFRWITERFSINKGQSK